MREELLKKAVETALEWYRCGYSLSEALDETRRTFPNIDADLWTLIEGRVAGQAA